MFNVRIIATTAITLSLLASSAHAAIMGMLYIGPENAAGLAVEKSATGELFLLLDMNKNAKRVEFGVSPGTPFGGGTVILSATGEPTAVLSIMSGEGQGLVNSENVKVIDATTERTHQRSNLSQDLKDLAEAQYLRDEKGKNYTLSEIKEVSFVFQVKKPGAFDTSLDVGTFKIADLNSGEVKQLAGTKIIVNPVAVADPIANKINSLDLIRKQEVPFPIAKDRVERVLVEIGYTQAEAQILSKELLDYKNNKMTAAEIIARHEAYKATLVKLGNNDRISRAANAAKEAGKIDPKATADRAAKK